MRSLFAPADETGTRLTIAVAAAVPAALAEAAVLCLPVHTITGGAAPIVVFLPLFLLAFAVAVGLATRHRSSPRVGPVVAVAAVVAGILVARGGAQREVLTVLVFLLVGLRAVALAFRDWRAPIAGSFLVGALALAIHEALQAARGAVA